MNKCVKSTFVFISVSLWSVFRTIFISMHRPHTHLLTKNYTSLRKEMPPWLLILVKPAQDYSLITVFL